mmetsp:Transcript_30793/g.45208  ORF Transcript_30793/g.45208 Transcript_30793/m.45208 type:complete len:92 (-) Transcript_30793:225-500(-)
MDTNKEDQLKRRERTYNPESSDNALHHTTDLYPPICRRCVDLSDDEGYVARHALYGFRISPRTGYIVDEYDELTFCKEHKAGACFMPKQGV